MATATGSPHWLSGEEWRDAGKVDAQVVGHGGGELVGVDGVVFGFGGGGVGTTVDGAGRGGAAGEDGGPAINPVVATPNGIEAGGTPKFSGGQDQRILEHTSAGEVLE